MTWTDGYPQLQPTLKRIYRNSVVILIKSTTPNAILSFDLCVLERGVISATDSTNPEIIEIRNATTTRVVFATSALTMKYSFQTNQPENKKNTMQIARPDFEAGPVRSSSFVTLQSFHLEVGD